GAESLVVHARTKQDGYKPPARWEWLARIREQLSIPVIANGEVWTLDDYIGIRAVSACDDVMLGRGAVADPLLALRIRRWQGEPAGVAGNVDYADAAAADWAAVLPLIGRFWTRVNAKLAPQHTPGRLKQWLGLMRRAYPQAEVLYQHLRPLRDAAAIDAALQAQGLPLAALRRAA
ncbi:MAG TPA: tRNA-dihydrouridine synthase, partial [Rhodocyclaceae bacterium]|nr:tRNA-dihydrouridine synthase [Rhodocyclaceae bacterium]